MQKKVLESIKSIKSIESISINKGDYFDVFVFCRKRDKRVAEWSKKLQEKAEENRKKTFKRSRGKRHRL